MSPLWLILSVMGNSASHQHKSQIRGLLPGAEPIYTPSSTPATCGLWSQELKEQWECGDGDELVLGPVWLSHLLVFISHCPEINFEGLIRLRLALLSVSCPLFFHPLLRSPLSTPTPKVGAPGTAVTFKLTGGRCGSFGSHGWLCLIVGLKLFQEISWLYSC